MKVMFLLLIIVHSLIHLIGFKKAFGTTAKDYPGMYISKPAGISWLTTAVLLFFVALLFIAGNLYWYIPAILVALLSQVLVFRYWKESKFGTVANVLIIVVSILAWGQASFEKTWQQDVIQLVNQSGNKGYKILTEESIRHLPLPVRSYIRFCGVLNKPVPRNMRLVFEGQMREKGKAYFPFHSVQYNSFDRPSRFFFMKATILGVTVPGYHQYTQDKANMDIRLFGLYPVARYTGDTLHRTETVTFFNDLCLFAPARLADSSIKWETIDSLSARAYYTTGNITISALLLFNTDGRLVNFISNDRTAVADMKNYPFQTPVNMYRYINHQQVVSSADAVWDYPDGPFVYGKFRLSEIEYDVTKAD